MGCECVKGHTEMNISFDIHSYSPTELQSAWIGKKPINWNAIKIKFIAPLVSNKITEKPEKLVYIGLENIESKTGKLTLDNIQESVESTVSLFKQGDVLFGKLRPYLAKVYFSEISGACSTELLVLRPNSGVDGKFLSYYLISDLFIGVVDSLTYGVKMPRASWNQVGNLLTPLPTIVEQKAIATFLDKQTSRIDNLITKKQQLIKLLEEKRQALISHAVTKGLNPDAPMKDSGIEWLGEIPNHWEIRRIKSIISSTQNGIWGEDPQNNSDDIICVRVADFDYEHLNISSDNLTTRNIDRQSQLNRIINKSDLLIEKSGGGSIWPVGRVVNFQLNERAVNSNFITKLSIKKEIDSRFLTYVFQTAYSLGINTKSIKQTTGIQNLDLASYLDEFIPVPPILEQQAIREFLDKSMHEHDEIEVKISQIISKLVELRSSIIESAVMGKIKILG